jgi:HlyD family secretion protein
MKRVSRLTYGLTAALLAAALLTGCMNAAASQTQFETQALTTGDVTAYMVANGAVRANRAQDITWQLGGQVGTVDGDVLDEVKAGQLLSELDANSLPQSILLAEVDLYNAKKSLEDLKDTQVAIAQAQLAVAQAQDALETALRERDKISPNRRMMSQLTIDTAKADALIAQQNLENVQEYFDQFKDLPEDNIDRAQAQTRLSQAIRQRDTALANLNYVTGKPSSTELALADGEVLVAQAKLAAAQQEYERIRNGTPADEVAAAQARVDAAQATLDQVRLTAPFDGVITYRAVQTGDRVQPGSLAFQIEDRSHLYVDVQVSEIDINNLKIGQSVELTFDAILGATYEGRVDSIGWTGNRASGVVTYPVVIELVTPDEQIKTGMTAVVKVQTQAVQDVLLVPNRAVRVVDGERVVYVQKGGPLPEAVKIRLGISSDTDSQVLESDLKVGDKVVTNPDLLVQMQGGGMSIGGAR